MGLLRCLLRLKKKLLKSEVLELRVVEACKMRLAVVTT